MSDVLLQANQLGGAHFAPISFALYPGEILMVQGESGAGKSQLLRALADLDAHSGTIVLRDVEQQQMPASRWRRQVMYLPAESAWWDDYVDAHFAHRPPDAWFSALRLSSNLFTAPVSRLSSGERQRLAVLRSLVLAPDVLLLDEPTANLDNTTAQATAALLAEQIRAQGQAAVWVTHDPAEAERLGDRQLFMHSASSPQV